MDVIEKRKSKIESWYLDLSMIRKYWGSERVYHHTAPISMIYALREGLKDYSGRRAFEPVQKAPDGR